MDGVRFDQFVRQLRAPASRRAALAALAALGVGSLAVGDARAGKKQCGKNKPCPECHKCTKKHKCKPVTDGTACEEGGTCQSGACACPGGSFACPADPGDSLVCCPSGQACGAESNCGSCPTISNVCNGTFACDRFGDGPNDFCVCATSLAGKPLCSSLNNDCKPCESDVDCTEAFTVCLDASPGPFGPCFDCPGNPPKICVSTLCAPPPPASQAGGRRHSSIDGQVIESAR